MSHVVFEKSTDKSLRKIAVYEGKNFVVNFFDHQADAGHYESFERTKANNWTCKFQFSYAVDNDNVKDKMHHIAAYIIQHAFRCGWDYRRALDDEIIPRP